MKPFRVLPCAVVTAILVAPAHALAATDRGEKTPLDLSGDTSVERHASSGGGSIVRTLVGLAVVIGVIYGLHWILKQVKASKEESASGQGLAVVATLPVGGDRSVKLVRAGSEFVLLGVADHGITRLRRYSQEEAERLGMNAPDASEDGGRPQGPLLRKVMDDLRERTLARSGATKAPAEKRSPRQLLDDLRAKTVIK